MSLLKLVFLSTISVCCMHAAALTTHEFSDELRDQVHSRIRAEIRDGFYRNSTKTSVQNMARANNPLDEDKLDSILQDIECRQTWVSQSYKDTVLDGWIEDIQSCFHSDDCYLAVYYAGFSSVPRDHGKRYFNSYHFAFLNEIGEETSWTLEFKLDSDSNTQGARPLPACHQD